MMASATMTSGVDPTASLPGRARSILISALQCLETGLVAAKRDRLARYRPYGRQAEFHAGGRTHRERLLMAGNQTGKTYAGAMELAMHLTGRYPGWWQGRRWARPVRAWTGSETAEVTRDGVQRALMGEPKDASQWGTGAIPMTAIVKMAPKRGVPNALDSVLVRHSTGAHSTLGFKSFDQGRSKWQAETLDCVWFDEEPPLEIYMEGLTRTNATGGMVYLTFTPLLGLSEVVRMFLDADSMSRTDAGRAAATADTT